MSDPEVPILGLIAFAVACIVLGLVVGSFLAELHYDREEEKRWAAIDAERPVDPSAF